MQCIVEKIKITEDKISQLNAQSTLFFVLVRLCLVSELPQNVFVIGNYQEMERRSFHIQKNTSMSNQKHKQTRTVPK